VRTREERRGDERKARAVIVIEWNDACLSMSKEIDET
jgi:hypothetical protein